MPTITLTIDAPTATRINNAFASQFAEQMQNGETKNAFTQRMIRKWIKDVVQAYEDTQAKSNVTPPADVPIT